MRVALGRARVARQFFPCVIAFLVLVATVSIAGCGDDDGGSPTTPASQAELAVTGPYAVASFELEFVDSSRETVSNGDFAGSDERRLPVRVWYPVAVADAGLVDAPPAAGGPFPLLGYAHGFTSGKEEAAPVGEHLVSHGYIVVAPDFPLSKGGAPGGPISRDIANQPGDLGFVMRELAALDHPVAAAIDTNRQGIFGLSLGGGTVVIGAYHPTIGLDFVGAAVAIAPASCFFGPDAYVNSVPTMLIGGSADELVPFDESPERSFGFAPGPTTLVRLDGGTHLGMLGIDVPDAVNTDLVVGCPLIDDLVDDAVALGSFEPSASLLSDGVPGDVLRVDGCDTERFCNNGFVQTMSGTRQVELVRVATLAHFEATLGGRADVAAFIDRVLGPDNEDVEVRSR